MTKQELNNAVSAVKNGDGSAFEKLYNEFYDPLRFYIAKRIGNLTDAEDIAQDTFVTALEKIGELKNDEAFKVWLYKIATNKTNAYFNDTKHFAEFPTDEELENAIEQADDYFEPLYVPADYLDNLDTQEEIRKSIDKLSADRRSALIMFYYENMKIKDIAAAMGINENAVGHRLSEARKQIAKRLKKKGIGNLVLVPLPLVLQAIAEKERAKGGAAFAVSSTAATGTAAASGTAAIGTSIGMKAAAAVIAAAVLGGTGYALSKLRDNSFRGEVRVLESGASDVRSEAFRSSDTSRASSAVQVIAPIEGDNSYAGDDMSIVDVNPDSQPDNVENPPENNLPQTPAAQQPAAQPNNNNNNNNNNGNNNGGNTPTPEPENNTPPPNIGAPYTLPWNEMAAELPEGVTDIQQQLVNRAFFRPNSEYETMLWNYDPNAGFYDDIYSNQFYYLPFAETFMNDVFSVLDDGYLPAGGLLYYDVYTDDDPTNDLYVYAFPPKLLRDPKTNQNLIIVCWLGYRQNYTGPNPSYLDTQEWNGYYCYPDPGISQACFTPENFNISYTDCTYWRWWDRKDNKPVQQSISIIMVDDDDLTDVRFQIHSFGMWDVDYTMSRYAVLAEDIPVYEDLDLLEYINQNEDAIYGRYWNWDIVY